jgi:hypothetical protein
MKISVGSLLAVLLVVSPAQAHTGPGATSVTWDATPCAIACGDRLGSGFSPCGAPFPPGGSVDVITSPAPVPPDGKTVIVEATIEQLGEWEMYICDLNGTELDRDDVPFLEYCQPDGPAVMTPIGPFVCHEDLAAVLTPGAQVILRAYNVAGFGPATGAYWFRSV